MKTERLEKTRKTKLFEEALLDAPLMEGVHTALGTSLLGRNSFFLNGCPGK
jgi:hypothetical protein